MCVGDKLWRNWNKVPMHLSETQLNFAVWSALSACRVSSAHLNYKAHPMIRSVYRFHVYYHVRGVLKRLQTPLPHRLILTQLKTLILSQNFKKIGEDYGVPMRYRDKTFSKINVSRGLI